MTTLEKKVDAMSRMLLGITDEDRSKARRELRNLLDNPAPPQDKEAIIYEMLKDIGIPCSNLGHGYLAAAISLAADDATYINGITSKLYPKLAAMFNTTASRVERAIRHSVEQGWSRGDVDVLKEYFGNTVSADKGKPTNNEFIAQLAGMVRLRMKQ